MTTPADDAPVPFPRQQARTRRFTLGVPRGVVSGVGDDGPRILFLRSRGGDDPVTEVWRLDPSTGGEVRLVDVDELVADQATLPAAERARRERAREQAAGVVAIDADAALRRVAFALGGRLVTLDAGTGRCTRYPGAQTVFDPRISPDGRRVAFHADDGVHVTDVADTAEAAGPARELVGEAGVRWGVAEFVAAEEMGRSHGLWWSPDSTRLAVTRVDESAVTRWWIADPANPAEAPVAHAYPAAGEANAATSLWIVDVVSGDRREVAIDGDAEEYLATVRWDVDPLTVLVQSRDQRRARVLTVDPRDGSVRVRRELVDDAWVEPIPGTPAWAGEHLVTVEDRPDLGEGGTRVLCLDGEPVTDAGLQVRDVAHADADRVVVHAADDPTRLAPYHLDVHTGVVRRLGPGTGVRRAVLGRGAGAWDVHTVHDPEVAGVRVAAVPPGTAPADADTGPASARGARAGAGAAVDGDASPSAPGPIEVRVLAEAPSVVPRPRMLRLGSRRLAAALLLPSHDDGGRLPVVLDPYGGPHLQRVVAANAAYLGPQWLADQGFAVLVVDGRGAPGRGPVWERAVHGDLAGPVLDDQVDALHAAAEVEPRLDLDRVGIRGWSFGGYLAALAVLRRPDVFRAAVAGAPVTDWRLYDTHYTERYLGTPHGNPGAYERSSLVDGGVLRGAVAWDPIDPPRLMLIHGLADDNVVAAHTLRLSSALLADGRAHTFLPLSGVTHMTPQEIVAERLLTTQVRFLGDALR